MVEAAECKPTSRVLTIKSKSTQFNINFEGIYGEVDRKSVKGKNHQGRMDVQATELKYKKRDDASARLAEKMLQGWALLGINCPNEGCFTPFVRSKQGKMYCVNCEQYALTEEEVKKQQEAQQQQQEEDEEAKAAAEQAEQERRRRIEQQFRLEEEAKRARELQELEQRQKQRIAITPAPPVTNGPAKRKSDDVPLATMDEDEKVNAMRRQTLAALYQKIGSLTEALTASDHSERLVSIAKTIRELAEVAKLLAAPQ